MMKEWSGRGGHRVALAAGLRLVSSGDPGIYAMAGLVFETCKIKKIPSCRFGSTG